MSFEFEFEFRRSAARFRFGEACWIPGERVSLIKRQLRVRRNSPVHFGIPKRTLGAPGRDGAEGCQADL
jgi:hypothetical protein